MTFSVTLIAKSGKTQTTKGFESQEAATKFGEAEQKKCADIISFKAESENVEKFDSNSTPPDNTDGHVHAVVSLGADGNGMTSVAGVPPHDHEIRSLQIVPMFGTGYVSRHSGGVSPVAMQKMKEERRKQAIADTVGNRRRRAIVKKDK